MSKSINGKHFMYAVVLFLGIMTLIIGCDNPCRPDAKLDKKGDEKGVYIGGKCTWRW